MLRFQAGDEPAFDELVQRNTPKVHALIFHFLGGPEYVEDLTQEVFLRIYRTAARYQPSAKFSTWLYRIVANLAFNVMRSRQRNHVRQLSSPVGDEDDGLEHALPDAKSPAPDEKLNVDELRQIVVQAISKLPENQKLALVLHQYEQKGYDEIAEVLECTTMAVKSLLSRARENLRQSLGRYLQEDAK